MIDRDRVHPVSDAVTREYRMDMQLHLYRRAHLEDLAERYLIPLSQESKRTRPATNGVRSA